VTATGEISCWSDVSPEMPHAPSRLPLPSRINTPPGLVTMRPPLAAASMVKNCGVFAARLASVRDPKPMPSAPQALANAMSKRKMPALSSRLKATRCPPLSSTATASGARLLSRPFLRAASTITEACASVTADISTPVSAWEKLATVAAGPVDRYRGNFSAARAVLLGFFVAGERPLDQRQLDTARFGLGEHRLHVLDGAMDAEGPAPASAALEHRGNPRRAHFKHVGRAGSVAEQLHEPVRIDRKRTCKRQRLAQGLPVNHQRQIDREFQNRSRSDRSGMFEPPA